MLFNSQVFVFVFLPLVVFVFYALLGRLGLRPALTWLVSASLFFYAWWNPSYLPLLLASVVANYAWARLGGMLTRYRGAWLCLGVGFNLGLLAYYKYAGFLMVSLSGVTGWQSPVLEIALPLAISFFTFQQIAFLVDCYRKDVRCPSFLQYLFFVTFFPQLIAGPIVQHGQLLPQLQDVSRQQIPWYSIAQGITLFSVGLFKKVMIADKLAEWSEPVFAAAAGSDPVALSDAWGGLLAFCFQLYFDFSGYSDMALGLGALFGISLLINFDSPYRATSIGDFWNRWHITLSSFLRDYLFRPLGGSPRRRPCRATLNMMVTMTLCGLWHGAGWTYVAFGAVHGCLLSAHHAWRLYGKTRWQVVIPRPVGWALTFAAFCLSLVLFRAEDLPTAGRLYSALCGMGAGTTAVLNIRDWLRILLMFPLVLCLPNAVRWVRGEARRWNWQLEPRYAFVAAGLLAVSLLHLTNHVEFLYFDF